MVDTEEDRELLIHISAPSRARDDEHFRKIAAAYRDFEVGTRHKVHGAKTSPAATSAPSTHRATVFNSVEEPEDDCLLSTDNITFLFETARELRGSSEAADKAINELSDGSQRAESLKELDATSKQSLAISEELRCSSERVLSAADMIEAKARENARERNLRHTADRFSQDPRSSHAAFSPEDPSPEPRYDPFAGLTGSQDPIVTGSQDQIVTDSQRVKSSVLEPHSSVPMFSPGLPDPLDAAQALESQLETSSLRALQQADWSTSSETYKRKRPVQTSPASKRQRSSSGQDQAAQLPLAPETSSRPLVAATAILSRESMGPREEGPQVTEKGKTRCQLPSDMDAEDAHVSSLPSYIANNGECEATPPEAARNPSDAALQQTTPEPAAAAQPVPEKPLSPFELLSRRNKERLAKLRAALTTPPARDAAEPLHARPPANQASERPPSTYVARAHIQTHILPPLPPTSLDPVPARPVPTTAMTNAITAPEAQRFVIPRIVHARPLRPHERGQWRVSMQGWPSEDKRRGWQRLTEVVEAGALGFFASAWRERECHAARIDDAEPAERKRAVESEDELDLLRVYCPGGLVNEVFVVLDGALGHQAERSRRPVWHDGEGKPVVEVRPTVTNGPAYEEFYSKRRAAS